MPLMTIDLPLELLHAISAEALRSDRDFSEVITEKLERAFDLVSPPVPPVIYDEEVAGAIARCRALTCGTVFSLNADCANTRRLFSREEWQVMGQKPGFRPNVLGRQFRKAVLAEALATLEDKTTDNKQLYRRT